MPSRGIEPLSPPSEGGVLSVERFEKVVAASAIPYRRERLAKLSSLVWQILLNLGVPDGVATQAAVERFLAAAGLEEAA